MKKINSILMGKAGKKEKVLIFSGLFDDLNFDYQSMGMMSDYFLTQNIIGCAIQVHKALGPGFLESIYDHSLRFEFQKRNIAFQFQEEKEVHYETEKVGTHRFDFLIDNRVIVEVKAIKSLEDIHFSQVRSYLKAWNLDAGLLINFATTPLTVRRVYREKKT